MNLKIGIVGLPNVGKSTLFNALTKSQKAAAENFPFCTIDPNVGLVEVPDWRVDKLAEIVHPERVVRSTIEFVDIAGLVKGAAEGEGLGNKFLSHIRECHAIAHVLRDFENTNIHHVSGLVDPASDLEVIITELILSDLESVNRQWERVNKKAKSGDKEAKKELALLERLKEVLNTEKMAYSIEPDLSEEELKLYKGFHLLTAKKFLIIANVDEQSFANFDEATFRKKINVREETPIIPICAKIEAELGELPPDEAQLFLEELGTKKSGLENLIQQGFELLGLQSYFTAGVKEVRAWTIKKGSSAPEAAGEIHTDFQKGFIMADVVAFDDFIAHSGEQGAKEHGKLRQEGKSYMVKDGDVMHFKFNV